MDIDTRSLLIIENKELPVFDFQSVIQNVPEYFSGYVAVNQLPDLGTLHKSPPKLILLDADFLQEEGVRFLDSMRKMAMSVPVVALVGTDSAELGIRMLKAGAQDYLIKEKMDLETFWKAANSAIDKCQLQRKLNELAHYDSLTGLLNRSLFLDRVKRAMADFRRYGRECALIFLDLDYFKSINDTYGHDVGDKLLKQVGRRISNCCRASDHCARLGGDEFVVLLPEITEAAAQLVAQKLIDAFAPPFKVDNIVLRVTPSIGVAHCPTTANNPEDLLNHADSALYLAKESGRAQFKRFEAEHQQRFTRLKTLKNALPDALHNHELSLYYQPIFSTRDKRITGIEILCRWPHRQYQVETKEVLSWINQMDLSTEFHQWLFEALSYKLNLFEKESKEVHVCINIGLRHLESEEIYNLLLSFMDKSQLSFGHVELEIDESEIAMFREKELEQLRKLKQLGFRISIDNFGLNDVALHKLASLPVDKLKISQHLNAKVNNDSAYRAIVSMLIQVADSLGKQCVVKGIESRAQWEFVSLFHKVEAQGFWLARPVPLPDDFHL